jgi:proteasome assembly chaperone (PAC2) family protein
MNTPGPEHFLFIPGILLVGMVIGYIMGAKAARAEIAKRKRRAKE